MTITYEVAGSPRWDSAMGQFYPTEEQHTENVPAPEGWTETAEGFERKTYMNGFTFLISWNAQSEDWEVQAKEGGLITSYRELSEAIEVLDSLVANEFIGGWAR